MLEGINKAVTGYNEMVYRSRPVKISDFLSDKYNIVHRKLYSYSLNCYLEEFINTKYISSNMFMYYLYNYCLNDANKEKLEDKLSEININVEETVFKLRELIEKEIAETLSTSIGKIMNNTISLSDLENKVDFEYIENLNDYDNDYNKDSIQNIDKISLVYSQDGNIYLCINDEIVKNNYKESISELNNYLYKANKKLKSSIIDIIIHYYKKSHKFIEIKNDEYWKPSSVIIIGALFPYNKKKISLAKYWNNYQNKERFHLDLLKITNENNIKDSQIEEIDYINGKVKVYSKNADITYDVDFDYIDEDTNINDDVLLSNTFTYKYRNSK